jgi:RNA polymerase sigma factor (sigma-70 family)
MKWDDYMRAHPEAWPKVQELLVMAYSVLKHANYKGDWDEAISDVCLPVAVRIVRKYDPSDKLDPEAAWIGYAWQSMRWAVTSIVARQERLARRELPLNEEMDVEDESFAVDEYFREMDGTAQRILDGCDELDRALLGMRFLMGMTFQEIGDLLGYSKTGAFKIVNQALARARERMLAIA